MAHAALVDKLIEAGARLVQALDSAGHSPSAALWLYRPEPDDWVFTIASPAFDVLGPKLGYRNVLGVLSKASPPLDPVRIDDVVITLTADPLLQSLRLIAQTPPDAINRIRFRRNVVNGVLIDDALVYRLAPPAKAAATA